MQDGGAITAKTENEHTPEFLKELQAMPLQAKVLLTQARIDEFYTGYNTIGYGNAYISFSGGKDSTVLLDIARKRYPDIPAVFSNTGLEYPEIRRFAKAHDNVEVVQPKIPFNEVISRYGYPLIGKEVAEAIYYARKIRSQDVQVERERDEPSHLIETSGAKNRRTILMGAYPPSTHTHRPTETPRVGRPTETWTRRMTELNGNLTGDETANRRAGVALKHTDAEQTYTGSGDEKPG